MSARSTVLKGHDTRVSDVVAVILEELGHALDFAFAELAADLPPTGLPSWVPVPYRPLRSQNSLQRRAVLAFETVVLKVESEGPTEDALPAQTGAGFGHDPGPAAVDSEREEVVVAKSKELLASESLRKDVAVNVGNLQGMYQRPEGSGEDRATTHQRGRNELENVSEVDG